MIAPFPSKDGKDIAYEEKNGWKSVYFPQESESFVFVVIMIKVFFPFCTSTWRVNFYVSCQGEAINRRNDSTNLIIIKNCDVLYNNYYSLLKLISCCCLETCFC